MSDTWPFYDGSSAWPFRGTARWPFGSVENFPFGGDAVWPFASAEGSFTDDFTNLSSWISEPGAGTNTVSGNELTFAGTSGEYNRIHRQVSDAAPATWSTITIECETRVTSSGSNNDIGIGLCMNNPPTGQPNDNSFPSNMMQDGYGILYRPSTFTERVALFAAGVRTQLYNTNDVSLAGGLWKQTSVKFTKLADRIRINRWYDTSAITQVDDTDASRQTGACTVVLYANAQGANVVKFRNLVVTVT